ncbi:TPA: extracellular solute-binding protein [Streptococcus suis]
MKKGFIKSAVVALTASLFMNTVVNTSVSAEELGDTVKYDTSVEINNGEDISFEYWTWNEGDPAIKLAEAYSEIHPNVTINVVNHPWSDYWTKLPLSLQGNSGPGVFNIHNSQHNLLINFLEPYAIPVEELEADFNGVAPHVIDGNVYYIDLVMNTGNIYYNKKMWEEAGLTENDIPKTWEQFREVAKKLTKKDGDNFVQAGFNWNGSYAAIYEGLNYQKGTLLFQDDETTPNYNNDVTKENMKFLVDLYDVDQVGNKDFGTDDTMSFGNGQSAMVYKWGWFPNELAQKYPDIEYGVFATPTFNEETPFAYDRYNGESTPGINKNQDEKVKAVSQDFIRFLLANNDYSFTAAQSYASFPTKKSISDDPALLENPVLAVIAPRVEKLIWPGPFPATIETSAQKAIEEVLYNGVEIDQAVEDAQAQMERDMRNEDFKSLEKSYQ